MEKKKKKTITKLPFTKITKKHVSSGHNIVLETSMHTRTQCDSTYISLNA